MGVLCRTCTLVAMLRAFRSLVARLLWYIVVQIASERCGGSGALVVATVVCDVLHVGWKA